MKCAIFLLALWAFETVFAVPSIDQQLWIAQLENVGYVEQRANDFINANTRKIQRAEEKNEAVSQCMSECYEFQEYFQNTLLAGVYACHLQAVGNKNLAEAERCYAGHRVALNREISRRNRNIILCIGEIRAGRPYYPPAAPQVPGQEAGSSTSNQPHNG